MSDVQVSVKAVQEHPKGEGWKLVTLIIENRGERRVTIDKVEYRWKDGTAGEKIVGLSLEPVDTVTLIMSVPDRFLEEGEALAVVYHYGGKTVVSVDKLKQKLKSGES
jgi:hypothetical protein